MNEELKKPNWFTYLLFSEVFAILVIIDQFTKFVITQSMAYQGMRPIIDDFLSFHYVRNTGSAFSMFADKSWGITMLSIISMIALAVMLFLAYFVLYKFRSRRLSIILLFLSAGTLGNLIDRVRLDYVIDFIRFDFGSYTFPIFNVADIYVTCSCILLAICLIFSNKLIPEIPFNDKKESDDSDEDSVNHEGEEDS
ncbi:MAG: signal peptidase II [Clostridiales bacterium]|nr:signal peptidase II [Candidatus Scatonaster coprocaballi]